MPSLRRLEGLETICILEHPKDWRLGDLKTDALGPGDQTQRLRRPGDQKTWRPNPKSLWPQGLRPGVLET